MGAARVSLARYGSVRPHRNSDAAPYTHAYANPGPDRNSATNTYGDAAANCYSNLRAHTNPATKPLPFRSTHWPPELLAAGSRRDTP